MRRIFFSSGLHVIPFVSFLFLIIGINNSYGQAKAWEGTITIPTYGWEDDVNPKFWAMEAGAKGTTTVKASITYPYNMQDHLSRKLEDVTYKAIFLENEYLKITCLPELGGRLHSVYDKTTNQESFHKNDVIKPSMIAMRGGFISGGIEWNAGPQVHTVTILSPVDVLFGDNNDGSAYIEVSNLEKSLRTRWTVRVTLHQGKALLDEDIKIYNPTDAMNPYYFWNCTAFPQLKGTRFIYPMSKGTDHFGAKYFNWPVNEGNDLSWTKNYVEASSVFAVDCAYDFFGAYDVDIDRGIVQVANHNEHPGKKAWTWGQGEYGRVSMSNLGDENPEYIEVQSGPLQTQSDYGILSPGAAVSWKEYWYPVHGLSTGFEFATDKVAIQTNRNKNKISISLISTEIIKGASCTIIADGKEIQSKKIDLSPLSAITTELNTSGKDTVTVLLKADEGEILANFRTPLPLPVVVPIEMPSYMNKDDKLLSAEECYRKAQKFDRALDRINARKYYNKAIELDSLHLLSLRDLAIMDFEACMYREAEMKLVKALNQIPNDDGLAWYFLGLCKLKSGDTDGAQKCGFKASRCSGTVSKGFDLVGRGYMLDKQFFEAEKIFLKAHLSDLNDPLIYHHYMMAIYAGGDKETTVDLAMKRIEECPTELTPRFLSAISGLKPEGMIKDLKHFVGEDDFEILESSLYFSSLGLVDEAISVLKEGCLDGKLKEQNHLILYQIAYLYSLINDKKKATEYLKKASANYQDFVLASRPEMEATLIYALEMNPEDALASYQLGNLYANFGRLADAEKYWELSTGLNSDISVSWRNLGLLNWIVNNNHDKSELCYRNAIKARPYDQTLYRDLAKVLLDDNRIDEAIALLEKMKYKGTKRSDVVIDLAQYYLDDKRYDKCVNLLSSVPYFVNWEGSSITWDIFNMANVKKGILLYEEGNYKPAIKAFEKALTFPENLGVGQSMRTEEAMAWFWKGKTMLAMGNTKEAAKAWKAGASTLKGSERQNSYIKLCSELHK
jgi:tetratricopeptide (TPR) repeat protein